MAAAPRSASTTNDERLLPILIVWMTLVLGMTMLYLQTQTALGGRAEASPAAGVAAPVPSEDPGAPSPAAGPSEPAEAPSAAPSAAPAPSPAPSVPSVDVASLVGRSGESDVQVANRSCAALAPLIPVITGQTGVSDASDPALRAALDGVAAVGGVEGGGPETLAVREAASALADGAREALESRDPNVQQQAIQRATAGLDTIKRTCKRIA